MIRFYIARLEAYDGPAQLGTENAELEFKVLVAMSDGKPEIARALIHLHGALSANLEQLRKEAKET